MPEIDEVLVYDAPWVKATSPRTGSRPEYDMARRLRKGRFDGAVIFTVYSQNPLPAAFLCYLADIPLRLAYCHENPYQLLTDLDRGVDPERPWLVIHPGASAASRRYPPESYAAVAGRLVREHGLQTVFTGTAQETGLVENIRSAMSAPSHSLAGQLDLAGLAGLIGMASLLITNNTGPAHVAAALGTPVVVLYALTNPQHTPGRYRAGCYTMTCPANTVIRAPAHWATVTACGWCHPRPWSMPPFRFSARPARFRLRLGVWQRR